MYMYVAHLPNLIGRVGGMRAVFLVKLQFFRAELVVEQAMRPSSAMRERGGAGERGGEGRRENAV